MPHDQLFKELLRAFFQEFLELFFPRVAERLDFSQVTFLDKEVFTDLPEGARRELDLVARILTREGEPELILVHIEVQARQEREFPYRMFEYFALLRLRHKLPVFPVVVYLAPGTGGLTRGTYTERLFEEEVLAFRYASVGLPDLEAPAFIEAGGPLAPALAALMRAGDLGRALQKASSLRQTLLAPVDEARKSLLLNVIETYIPLDPAEDEEFRRLVGREELQEIKQMLTVYEERGIVKGLQAAVLMQMREKFGELPQSVVARVQEMRSQEELSPLLKRVLNASSLADMEIDLQ